MLEEVDLSGGYTVLMQLTGNLFNSQTHIEPVELMRLDESNFRLALNAIQIRRARCYVRLQPLQPKTLSVVQPIATQGIALLAAILQPHATS